VHDGVKYVDLGVLVADLKGRTGGVMDAGDQDKRGVDLKQLMALPHQVVGREPNKGIRDAVKVAAGRLQRHLPKVLARSDNVAVRL